MLNFVASIFLGMLPEVLYFTLFLIYSNKFKDKRIKLFCLLVIGYVLLIMLCRYQLLFYVTYIAYSYLVIRRLYNVHISNVFVIALGSAYLTLVSFLSFTLFDNYTLAYIIDRVLIFIPLLLVNYKLNNCYAAYLRLWDRKEGNKIKSLTLRNISLVLVNIFIVLLNFFIILVTIDYMNSIS